MKGRNILVTILVIITGAVIGGLVAKLVSGSAAFSWLSYGATFGISTPLVLDLSVIQLTFGLMFQINIATVIGIILALLLYRWLVR